MKYLIFALSLVFCANSYAHFTTFQYKQQATKLDSTQYPSIFIIGQNEKQYDAMTAQYPSSVLSASGDDVNKAFKKWMGMVKEMQSFAEKTNFELNGLKFWLNTFYAQDGTVEHFAYYLKPTSRNIPEAELKAFLSSFMKYYKLPLSYKSKFAHYGQVAFPILPENISN